MMALTKITSVMAMASSSSPMVNHIIYNSCPSGSSSSYVMWYLRCLQGTSIMVSGKKIDVMVRAPTVLCPGNSTLDSGR
jgi:hypothetical protein